MINSTQYKAIRLRNYDVLSEIISENFNIRCSNLIFNDDNEDQVINDGTFFGIMVIPSIRTDLIKNFYGSQFNTDNTNVPKIDSMSIEIDTRLFNILNSLEFEMYLKYEINKFENIHKINSDYYDFLTTWSVQSCTKIPKGNNPELYYMYQCCYLDYVINNLSLMTVDLRHIEENVRFESIVNDDLLEEESNNIDELIKLHRKLKLQTGNTKNFENSPTSLTRLILTGLSEVNKNKAEVIHYVSLLKKNNPIHLYKKMYSKIMECLHHTTNGSVDIIDESAISEFINKKIYLTFKNSSVKRLDNQVYEMDIKANSVQSKEEALNVLREINSIINVLDSILSDPKLDEYSIKKFDNVRIKYIDLRDRLVNNPIVSTHKPVVTFEDLVNGKYYV